MNDEQKRVCEWASRYMHQATPWAVLDTETTGLGPADEVIELAIISSTGHVLFSSLIQPRRLDRGELGTEIHGISRQMLATAPTFPEVWPQIEAVLDTYPTMVVYNADFDHRMLRQTAKRYGCDLPPVSWSCLMEQYAIYHGAWNEHFGSYTWQRLQVACECFGVQVEGQYHRATYDTFCTLGVLHALAARHQSTNEEQR